MFLVWRPLSKAGEQPAHAGVQWLTCHAEKVNMEVGVGLQFSCAAVLHPSHRALAALGGFRKDRGPGLAVVKKACGQAGDRRR